MADPNPGAPFPTRPVRRGPPRIGTRVSPQVARLAKASGAMDPALASRWADAVGADLASLCRPVRLKRQKNAVAIEVSVRDGAAAMRLQYAQAQLLDRLRTHLKEPRLTRLLIRQSGAVAEAGPTQRWASRKIQGPPPEAPAPPPRPARSLEEALERLRAAMDAPSR